MRLVLIPFFILFFVSLATASLTDSLLIHYTFNNDIEDISGHDYHGEGFNIEYIEDRDGNQNGACYFNGLDGFINLPNEEHLKPELPVTIAFWIRYDSEDFEDRAVFNTSFEEDVNSGIMFTSQNATGKYAMGFGDGGVGYGSNSRRSFVCDTEIEMDVWHHISMVIYSATDMDLYINCHWHAGEFSGTGGDLQYSLTPGTLGRHDQHTSFNAYYFEGALDDFRYWNRALTDAELVTLCSEDFSSIAKNPDDFAINVYPNPCSGKLHVDTDSQGLAEYYVYNEFGRLSLNGILEQFIDLSELQRGLYIIQFINGSEQWISKRVMIN